jgi:hypothetical protein
MKNLLPVFLLLLFVLSVGGQTKIKPPPDLARFLKVKASALTVKAVDIDGDRKPEYLVNDANQCGAGRCSTFLYQRKGKGFTELFSVDTWLNLDKGSTQGMRNLVSLDWSGNYNLRSHYRWNGQEYIEFKCTQETRAGKGKGKIKQIPCDEQ